MPARRIRKLLAALCVFALLVGVTAPVYASSNRSMSSMMEGTDPVSPAFDILILRPVGIFGAVTGLVLFAATSPIVLITRPHEIGTLWRKFVVGPAKYVWSDPIGQH